MNIAAGNHFAEDASVSPYFNELVYNEEHDMYYMNDEVSANEGVGTLVGNRGLPTAYEDQLEIDFSIEMNEYFAKFYENNENIVWVYYISENDFVCMYPQIDVSEGFLQMLSNYKNTT